MIKNILVQVGERVETRVRTVPAQYNEMGELISDSYDETYTVNVPVMEARNVEMTAEEIAELEAMQAAMPEPEQSAEKELADAEAALALLGVEMEATS